MLHSLATSISKHQLSQAISEGAIRPAYQPIVHLQTGAISSFEILARWRDPMLGDIPPGAFIPAAESHDLIVPLTEAIVTQACTAAISWPGRFRLTFNISPLHFNEAEFPDFLVNAVRRIGFDLNRGGQDKSSSKSCAKVEWTMNVMPLVEIDREVARP